MENLQEFGIGVIIEKREDGEWLRFKSVPIKMVPDLSNDTPERKALRRGARLLDLGRRLQEEMRIREERESLELIY